MAKGWKKVLKNSWQHSPSGSLVKVHEPFRSEVAHKRFKYVVRYQDVRTTVKNWRIVRHADSKSQAIKKAKSFMRSHKNG